MQYWCFVFGTALDLQNKSLFTSQKLTASPLSLPAPAPSLMIESIHKVGVAWKKLPRTIFTILNNNYLSSISCCKVNP